MPKQISTCDSSNKKSTRKAKRTSKAKELVALAQRFRLHPAENSRVIERLYSSINTPIALSCYLLYKHGEFDQLVNKEIHPDQYNDPLRFRDDFAAVSLLRKNGSLKTTIDRKEVALAGFKAAEVRCKESNDRIKTYLRTGQIYPGGEYQLNAVIRKIDRILGSFDIDKVVDNCCWGPGVSHLVKGTDTSGARKFDVERGITQDAYRLFGPVMEKAFPQWDAWTKPEFAVGNHIITVPKNAKTDRTIAIEPGLNTWIQLGIGKSIRRRLRFAGYNLDSDLKNQRGAFVGSLDDSLATIDFRAASDTIAREVVELLLPYEWFVPLNAARSQNYILDKDVRRAEKFSTMGNGFTFELESLIFLACALAVCETLGLDDTAVSVFGDDIILPSEAVAEYTALVGFLGFEINKQKSFSVGPFRESCGSYYFNGVDVKPFFIKKDLIYVKDLFRLANAIRYLAHVHNFGCGCDARYRSVWSLVIYCLPERLRLFGPVSAGDAVIHRNLDEVTARKPQTGWCGYIYTGLPEVPINIEKSSLGLLLARLHRPSRDMPYGNNVPLRARTRMVAKTNMFVHSWYDFGPWY